MCSATFKPSLCQNSFRSREVQLENVLCCDLGEIATTACGLARLRPAALCSSLCKSLRVLGLTDLGSRHMEQRGC